MASNNGVIEKIEKGQRNYSKTYMVLTFSSERYVLQKLPNGWGNEIVAKRSGDRFFGPVNRYVEKLTFYEDERAWLISKVNEYGIGVRIGCEIWYIEQDLSNDRLVFEGSLDITSCEVTEDTFTAPLIESSVLSDFLNNLKTKQVVKGSTGKYLGIQPRQKEVDALLSYGGIYLKGGDNIGSPDGNTYEAFPNANNTVNTKYLYTSGALPANTKRISVLDEKKYTEDPFNFGSSKYPNSIVTNGANGFTQNFYAGFEKNGVKSAKSFLLKNLEISFDFRGYNGSANKSGSVSQRTTVTVYLSSKNPISYWAELWGPNTIKKSTKVPLITFEIQAYCDMWSPPINASSEYLANFAVTFTDKGLGESGDIKTKLTEITRRRVSNAFINLIDLNPKNRPIFIDELTDENSYNIEIDVKNSAWETHGLGLGVRLGLKMQGLQVEKKVALLPDMQVKAMPLLTVLKEACKASSQNFVIKDNVVAQSLSKYYLSSESMLNFSLVRPEMQVIKISPDVIFDFLLKNMGITWRFAPDSKTEIELVKIADLLSFNNGFEIEAISRPKNFAANDILYSDIEIGRIPPQNANIPVFDPTNGARFSVFKKNKQGLGLIENRGEELALTHNFRTGGTDITPILKALYENSLNPTTNQPTYSPENIYYFESSNGIYVDNSDVRNDYVALPEHFDGTQEAREAAAAAANKQIKINNNFGIFINPDQRLLYNDGNSYKGIIARIRLLLDLYAIMYDGINIESTTGSINIGDYQALMMFETGKALNNDLTTRANLLGVRHVANIEYSDAIKDMVLKGRLDGLANANGRLVLITSLKMNFATTLCEIEYYPLSTTKAEVLPPPLLAKPTISVKLKTFNALTIGYNLTNIYSEFEVYRFGNRGQLMKLNTGDYLLDSVKRTITIRGSYSESVNAYIVEITPNGTRLESNRVNDVMEGRPFLKIINFTTPEPTFYEPGEKLPLAGCSPKLFTPLQEGATGVPYNLGSVELVIDGGTPNPITWFFPNGYLLDAPTILPNMWVAIGRYSEIFTIFARQKVRNEYLPGGFDYGETIPETWETVPDMSLFDKTWSDRNNYTEVTFTRAMRVNVEVIGHGGNGSLMVETPVTTRGGGGGGGGAYVSLAVNVAAGEKWLLRTDLSPVRLVRNTSNSSLDIIADSGYSAKNETGGNGGFATTPSHIAGERGGDGEYYGGEGSNPNIGGAGGENGGKKYTYGKGGDGGGIGEWNTYNKGNTGAIIIKEIA